MRALLARGTLYSLATGLQLGMTLVVLPVITRLLPASAYGVVAVALVVQLALGLVGAAGFPETMPRTYFASAEGPSRARAVLGIVLVTASAAALVAELSGPLWSPALLDAQYDATTRLAVWSSVPLALLLTVQAFLRASDRAAAYLLSAVLGSAGAQAAGLALVLAWEATPTAYLAGVASGLAAAAVHGLTLSGITLRGLADRPFLRASARISLPAVSHGLALYTIWAGNRAVVSHLEGTAAAGRFQVAFLVGGLTVLFVSAIYTAWAPIVFGTPDERRWTTLVETTDAVNQVTAIAAAATAVAAPVALVLLAPDEYEPLELSTVSALVALSAVPFVSYCASLQVVLWHGRTGVLALLTPVAAAVNLGANIVLVPVLGLSGAALATVVSYAVLAALMHLAADRLHRVDWRYGSLARALALTGFAVALSALAPAGGAWLGVRLVVALALAGVLATVVRRLR